LKHPFPKHKPSAVRKTLGASECIILNLKILINNGNNSKTNIQ
jgi:hypothetical protein